MSTAEEIELFSKAVKCEACGMYWVPGTLVCQAEHYGKGCCHYGDTLLSAPKTVEPVF